MVKRLIILSSSRILSIFLLLFTCTALQAQDTVYTSSGTFKVPVGVTKISVQCWGGGGAGGGVTGKSAAGGGGAGGAYAIKTLTVTPGQQFTVTVGGTKTGTTNGTASANKGNPSWFGTQLTVFAEGGNGGNRASTNNINGTGGQGSSTASVGDTVRQGGDGASGNRLNYGGAGGGVAGPTGDGGNASGATGGIGNSSNGNGGNGPYNDAIGNPGQVYGGGGSGAKENNNTDRRGGDGASGRVIIKWPVITVIPAQIDFGYTQPGSTSSPESYQLIGQNLQPKNSNITVTAPLGFEISLSENTGYSTALSIPYSNHTLSTNVFVRFKPILSQTDYSGNVSNNGGGAKTEYVLVTGTTKYNISVTAVTTPTCEGSSSGTITVTATGGIVPYQYKIGNFPYQESNLFTGLPSGTYSVRVKDVNNKTGYTEATVGFLPVSMPLPEAVVTNSSCNNFDGSIIITNIPTSLVFTKTESNYADLQTSILNNLSRFTLEGWIKLDKSQISGSRTWGLLGQNDAIEFGIMDNATLQLWSATGGTLNVPMSEYPDDNDWHHVAAVGNGSQMAIYIDGNLAGSISNNVSNYGSSNYHTVIGGHVWDATGNYFNGSMLKAGFWSRAFTAEEIQSLLYTKFKQYNSNETGLIAGFNLFEGTGNIISGTGSSNTTGALINSPEWVEVFTYLWEKTGSPTFSANTKNISLLDKGEYSLTASFEGICPVTGTWTIVASGNNQWTGDSDINWNNPANWTCNVPTLEDDALIPTGLTNYPVLQVGNTGTVNNLTIQQGASLTIIDKIIEIAGTISNSGIFNCEQGTIEMHGNSLQQIAASCFTLNTIKELIINNPNNVSLNGTLKITGMVKVQSGDLFSNTHLILLSDNESSAFIDGSGMGEIIGEVIMERYLHSAYGYKFISSPFQSMTVGQFADDVDLNSSFASFWEYDESNETTGWESYTDPQSALEPGKGYALNFGTIGGEKTMTGTGIVNNGTIGPLPLYNNNKEYTRGFNLIGNPYPSPINWDASGWIKENVDNAVYYFDASETDPYAGTYSSYVEGISSDGIASPIIPSQQGFFVHVNNDQVEGSLTFNNTIRVNDLNPVFHKNSTQELPLIRLSAAFENTSSRPDYLVLYFKPEATASLDPFNDALKILNTDTRVPNLYYLTNESDKSSIKSLDETGDLKIIPIGISASAKGRIKISKSDIIGLEEFNIYLKDKSTGKITDLKASEGHSFDIDNAVIDDRFVLIFSREALKEETFGSGSFNAYCENGIIYLQLDLIEEQVNVQLTDMSGKVLLNKDIYGEGRHVLGNIQHEGVGIITMSTGMGMVSEKILLKR